VRFVCFAAPSPHPVPPPAPFHPRSSPGLDLLRIPPLERAPDWPRAVSCRGCRLLCVAAVLCAPCTRSSGLGWPPGPLLGLFGRPCRVAPAPIFGRTSPSAISLAQAMLASLSRYRPALGPRPRPRGAPFLAPLPLEHVVAGVDTNGPGRHPRPPLLVAHTLRVPCLPFNTAQCACAAASMPTPHTADMTFSFGLHPSS